MNGEPDGSPIVPSFPLADMTSALYTVNAIMFALYHRDVHGGTGQVADVALFESLFSVLGPLAAEYAASGRLRERNGSRSKNAGPRGCYRTSDGRFLAVSGSTPKMAERFLVSYGLGDLLADERFATNEARVNNGLELDAAIASAIASRTLDENREIINRNALTAHAVQTVADIECDPQWQSRQLLLDVPSGSGTVRMHNVVPRLSATPGEITSVGGALGEHNRDVYAGELGLECDDIVALEAAGVI
jgi:crotonobetainyl-CoA:carnitine CoA-transferase CaiB-like acyl-CoA transferase